MKGLSEAFLTYKDEATNSDKYYIAEVIDLENGYAATFFNWGRRGSAGQEQIKVYPSLGQAITAYDKKVADKHRKSGYTIKSENSSHMISTHVAGQVEREADKFAGGKEHMTKAPVFTSTTVDLTSLVSLAQQGVTLALGTEAQRTEAIVIRSKLKEQMAELNRLVTEASGRMDLLDTVLEGALA